MNKPILCLYRPQPERSKYELFNSVYPNKKNESINKAVDIMNNLIWSKLYFFWSFSELSAMIAGMEDSKKYVIINYQSPDELDTSFEHFMGNWLWTAICMQSVAYYHLECNNNNNWNVNIFQIVFVNGPKQLYSRCGTSLFKWACFMWTWKEIS